MSWLKRFAVWLAASSLAPKAFGYRPSLRLLLAFWLLGVQGGHTVDLKVEVSGDLNSWADAYIAAAEGRIQASDDNGANWADPAELVLVHLVSVSATGEANWADAIQVVTVLPIDVPVSDDLANWADAVLSEFGYVITLDDDDGANWQDLYFALPDYTDQIEFEGRYHIPLRA